MIEVSLAEAEGWRASPVTMAMFMWLDHQIGLGKEQVCELTFQGKDARAEAGRLKGLILVRRTLEVFGTETAPAEELFIDPATRDATNA